MQLAGMQKAPPVGAFLLRLLLSIALVLAVLPGPARSAPPGPIVTVRYVVDGDTVILQGGRHVRLIGINAPELGRDGAPDQPLARDARLVLQGLVGRRRVRLVVGTDSTDRYGRLLAHIVLADGRTAQQHLLRRGLASVIAYPPNLRYLRRYQRAEAAARQAGLGIWGHRYYASVPVERINRRHRGYRFIHGRVKEIRRGRSNTTLVMGRRLVLQVPHPYRRYFDNGLGGYLNKRVEARGWLTSKHGKFRLRIRHPAMLKVID